MKKILVAGLLSGMAIAQGNLLFCSAHGKGVVYNDMGPWMGTSEIMMKIEKSGDEITLRDMTGYIKANYSVENIDELIQDQYSTESFFFSESSVTSKENNRAWKYKSDQYYYFKGLRPKHYYGDLFSSNVVIKKDFSELRFIFQIEQNGGTAVLKCEGENIDIDPCSKQSLSSEDSMGKCMAKKAKNENYSADTYGELLAFSVKKDEQANKLLEAISKSYKENGAEKCFYDFDLATVKRLSRHYRSNELGVIIDEQDVPFIHLFLKDGSSNLVKIGRLGADSECTYNAFLSVLDSPDEEQVMDNILKAFNIEQKDVSSKVSYGCGGMYGSSRFPDC